jgi:hypothetical protein
MPGSGQNDDKNKRQKNCTASCNSLVEPRTYESQITPGGHPFRALVKSRRVGFSSALVTTGSPYISLTETYVTKLLT